MKRHRWSEVTREQLNPLCERQAIHTDRMTLSKLFLRAGAVVPRHSHENEQVTILESGKLKFIFDDHETILVGGECLQVPSHAPHAVETLEDSIALDVFAPVRADWVSGNDAYLRGGGSQK
jgi:quercetin dioxygenase-like cupin family protein